MKRFLIAIAALLIASQAQAACWQWSKTASGNATADPSINWAEGMSPSSVNDSARAMMARLAECRDDISGLLATGGTSTAYTLTTNQGILNPPTTTVPQDGQQVVARFHTANGAAPTLTVDTGSAYPIQTKVGTAVASATLQTDGVYRLTFKLSATAWLLQDFYNAPIATNSVTYDKIQQASASRLIGNPTGSTANVQEISLGAGLSFSGTSLVATVDPTAIPGYISGLEMSTAGGSGTFTVARGGATDVNYGGTLYLSAAISKTTASWAVGTGNGGLDNGSIAINTWYHQFIIKRPDTGVVDICFGTDPTTGCAAGVGNIPAAYTLKRRIGSMKTNASNQWLSFTQVADLFLWSAHITDTIACGLARVNTTLTSVPTGVLVRALGRLSYAGGGTSSIAVMSPAEADYSPGGASPDADLTQNVAGNSVLMNVDRLTNLSAQVACRATNAGATPQFNGYGWIDARGK